MEKKTNLNVRVMIDKTFDAFGKDNMQKIINLLANFAVNYVPEDISYSQITYEAPSPKSGIKRAASTTNDQGVGQRYDDRTPRPSDRMIQPHTNMLIPAGQLKQKSRTDEIPTILHLGTSSPDKQLGVQFANQDQGLATVNLVVPLNKSGTLGNPVKK